MHLTVSGKEWLENRLEELADIFAVAVGGFSVMDNHLHVLVRLDPDVAEAWSDEEVVRRWGRLYPPRDKSRRPMPVTEHWVQWRLSDAPWVATARQRLQSLSWFMKCLKEPLSRLANRQDKTRGTFLKGRSFCLHSRWFDELSWEITGVLALRSTAMLPRNDRLRRRCRISATPVYRHSGSSVRLEVASSAGIVAAFLTQRNPPIE